MPNYVFRDGTAILLVEAIDEKDVHGFLQTQILLSIS